MRPGISHGATDEFGFAAVVNVTHSCGFHAAALHLLGIDHERLTWSHNGHEQRLTSLEGNGVIKSLG